MKKVTLKVYKFARNHGDGSCSINIFNSKDELLDYLSSYYDEEEFTEEKKEEMDREVWIVVKR